MHFSGTAACEKAAPLATSANMVAEENKMFRNFMLITDKMCAAIEMTLSLICLEVKVRGKDIVKTAAHTDC